MSNLRAICRPHTVFFSSIATCCCRDRARFRARSTVRVSFRNPNSKPGVSVFSPLLGFDSSEMIPRVVDPWGRSNHHRRTLVRAANWQDTKSPYETLGINSLYHCLVPEKLHENWILRVHVCPFKMKQCFFFVLL